MQFLKSTWNYFFQEIVEPKKENILFEELYSKNLFTPIVSEEELKNHDERNNDKQWMVLEGKVVDITNWKVSINIINYSSITQVDLKFCWSSQEKMPQIYLIKFATL
jgi:hypothetical protein